MEVAVCSVPGDLSHVVRMLLALGVVCCPCVSALYCFRFVLACLLSVFSVHPSPFQVRL